MKLKISCDMCGKEFFKDSWKLREHNFCSRQCLADFSSKKKNPEHYMDLKDFTNMGKFLSEHNKELNKTRMTSETRAKLRKAHLNSGEGKTYTKLYGVHEHRVIAEQMLGRPLKKGEVVHHIDGNCRNNAPENLMVLPSQKEHAELHARFNKIFGKTGGDAR